MSIQLDIVKSNFNVKTNLHIASAYFPDSKKNSDEYQEFNDNIGISVKSKPKKAIIIIGSDANSILGIHKSTTTSSKQWNAQRPHNNVRLNYRGHTVITMLKESRLKNMNSFYLHDMP
jgi:hypothetical protein